MAAWSKSIEMLCKRKASLQNEAFFALRKKLLIFKAVSQFVHSKRKISFSFWCSHTMPHQAIEAMKTFFFDDGISWNETIFTLNKRVWSVFGSVSFDDCVLKINHSACYSSSTQKIVRWLWQYCSNISCDSVVNDAKMLDLWIQNIELMIIKLLWYEYK